MLKKIAIATLISGFAIASFAQAGATAATSAMTTAPVATEQKTDKPHCDPKNHPHCKNHHHHKKAEAKIEAPAATK